MFYSPETCGGEGGNFEKMGWWRIEPGACANVYANDLEDVNRYWFYYGQADNGEVWAGPYVTSVPVTAFGGGQWCWGLGKGAGSNIISIGYRELDVGSNDTYTLSFVP